MREAIWSVMLTCGLLGCGDDSAATSAETEGSTTGGETTPTTGPTTTNTPTTGSSGAADESSGSATMTETTSETSSGSSSTGQRDESSGGEDAEEIVVHTEAPQQPVIWNAADGSLVGWTLSDADGQAIIPSEDAGAVGMVSSFNQGQWTTVNAVAPGDELWLQWRPDPDTTEVGLLRVQLPAADEHPTPDDIGFTQLSIGCGDTFVGVPDDATEATLPIAASCVPESGLLNLVAYAQGGPQISVVGVAELPGIAWTEGETTDVDLPAWTTEPPEVVFTTTDALANPVYNTVLTQWIEGIKYPMPRRSGSPGTRLFPAPSLAEQLQYNGSTDLGQSDPAPSRMFFGQRGAVPEDGSHDIPISDLLLPEITSTTASKRDGQWELSVQSPRSFDGADAIIVQSRWAGGFWAFMAPADQVTVRLPELPAEWAAQGVGDQDNLDTPFAVVVDVESYEGYDAFRPRGSYFLSGPDVLPGEEESFVRGAVYFPSPF